MSDDSVKQRIEMQLYRVRRKIKAVEAEWDIEDYSRALLLIKSAHNMLDEIAYLIEEEAANESVAKSL